MEEADGEAKQKGGDLKEVHKTRFEVLPAVAAVRVALEETPTLSNVQTFH